MPSTLDRGAVQKVGSYKVHLTYRMQQQAKHSQALRPFDGAWTLEHALEAVEFVFVAV